MKFKKIIVLFICIVFIQTNSYHLFFDLNGVLLKTSWLKAFKKLGIDSIICPDIKDRLFEFMNFIDKDKTKNNIMFQGNKLPSFFCDWQKGKISSRELTDIILKGIEEHHDFFKSSRERKLMKKIAEFFLPENNVAVNTTIPSMIKLVRDCKNKRDKNGKLVNDVYLTSNFDPETFELVREEFPEIIGLFDEDKIIISGDIKHMKPDPEFFEHILEKFTLNPNECCLIDDTMENIEGAKKVGIKGILYTSTYKTRRLLKSMHAL